MMFNNATFKNATMLAVSVAAGLGAAVAGGCATKPGISAATRCDAYFSYSTADRHDAAQRLSIAFHTPDAGNPMMGLSLDSACGTNQTMFVGQFFDPNYTPPGSAPREVPARAVPTTAGTVPTTQPQSSAGAQAAPVPAGRTITGPTPCPPAEGASTRASAFTTAPPLCIDTSRHWTATFDTTEGAIVVALDTVRTPGTVSNFVVLSRYHYYDGSSFDRIDTSIDIIQGGSPTTQSISDPGPGYTITDEGGKFTYSPGDLVMARSQGANSGAAQYFFVVGPKGSALDSQGTYVTFGHVTAGLDVLRKVEGLYQACDPSDQRCLGGRPSRAVVVNRITTTSS